jgi:hypothetical protein
MIKAQGGSFFPNGDGVIRVQLRSTLDVAVDSAEHPDVTGNAETRTHSMISGSIRTAAHVDPGKQKISRRESIAGTPVNQI